MERTPLVGAVAAIALSASALLAQETSDRHVVTPEQLEERVVESTARRAESRRVISEVIGSPEGTTVTCRLGIDGLHDGAAAAELSDRELGDLAARTCTLQMDPSAGQVDESNWRWWLAGAAAAMLIVLITA